MNRRRRAGAGGSLLILAVVLAVVFGGLYLADRYAHRRVEQQVAAQLRTELGTPRQPTVTIEGTPFLTQVAGQHVKTVHLVADQVGATTGARPVVAHADVRLTDVRTNDWWRTMTADHATGTALVTYPDLQDVAGVPLTYVGGGRFRSDTQSTVFGVPVKAQVTGTLALNVGDQTVSLHDPQLVVAGVTLPEAAASELLQSVVKPIPITGLPLGLTVTGIEARDDGLHARLAGDHVVLRR